MRVGSVQGGTSGVGIMEQSLEVMIPLPPTFMPEKSSWLSLWSLAEFKASIQPWTDFFSPTQLVKPDAFALTRLRYNLRHFQGNYVILALLIAFVYL